MTLINSKESAFEFAKNLCKDADKDLHESLVVQYTDPHNEWGHNNIRDLVVLFHTSAPFI